MNNIYMKKNQTKNPNQEAQQVEDNHYLNNNFFI